MPRSQKISGLLVVVVALLGAVYTVVSHNKPLLGLDLQGGVSVVLQPTAAATDEGLNQSVEIIRSRVDALGVAEPEISRQGNTIVVDLPGITLYGPTDLDQRGGVVSFGLEGVHPHDIGQVLDTHGVAIRTGHHCAQPVMTHLHIPATARASFYMYNTTDEVDALAEAITEAARFFGHARV